MGIYSLHVDAHIVTWKCVGSFGSVLVCKFVPSKQRCGCKKVLSFCQMFCGLGLNEFAPRVYLLGSRQLFCSLWQRREGLGPPTECNPWSTNAQKPRKVKIAAATFQRRGLDHLYSLEGKWLALTISILSLKGTAALCVNPMWRKPKFELKFSSTPKF